jgi:hypothetical protein
MSWTLSALKFVTDRRGNFAVIAGLLSPILLGLVGGSVDLFVYSHHRQELQETAEAAVLGAASEAGLKGWSTKAAEQVVAYVIESILTNRFSGATFDYNLQVDEKRRRIDLELTQDHYGYFFLGYFTSSPQIGVRASAIATGQATICLISQSPSEAEALSISGNSKVQAAGCSAYSNSASPKGIAVKDDSRLTTQVACSAGGYTGKGTSYSPLPITDCPSLSDPLSARAISIDKSVAGTACTFKKMSINRKTVTLDPGTYCDGLKISDAAKVTLNPGIYVVKNGPLRVDKSASLSGDGVGFVFVGDPAKLELKNESAVSLSAPKTGLMSGLLMYAQSTGKKPRDFKIESRDAQRMIGTVYLPGDVLIVGGDKDGDGVCDDELADDGTVIPAGPACISDVGTTSAWTAIVARKVKITAGSSLILNADYSGSDIPVPDGIGPNSNKIRLAPET